MSLISSSARLFKLCSFFFVSASPRREKVKNAQEPLGETSEFFRDNYDFDVGALSNKQSFNSKVNQLQSENILTSIQKIDLQN